MKKKYLYKVLKKQRELRGAIDFDTVEAKFLFDSKGHIEKIIPEARKVSHCIIEECMLCANVATAKYLTKHGFPFLRRSHPEPDNVKMQDLKNYLNLLGLSLNKKPKAPIEVRKERMAICGKCEYFKNSKCELCGCFMPLKTTFSNMTCPHDPPKWTEV